MALMGGLAARGHGIAFLGSCPVLLRLCEESGILSGELQLGTPPVSKWNAMSFLWRKKSMQKRLCSAIREFGALDAIVMLSLTEKLLLTPFALERGIQVFWLEHDGVGRWLTRNPWLPTLRKLSRSVTTIVVSDLSKKLYVDLGWPTERVKSIPNGVDANRFSQCVIASSIPNTPIPHSFHIGTIARLTEDKGVDILIDAVTDLPGSNLTIVGQGREEGYLRKLLDERRLTDRIRIVPTVEDLGSFYRSLDVFVLPSRSHDPFGLVAAEAMMLGIPTIVTDQCGIASHIKAGTDALVVEAESSPALKNALEEMLLPERRTALAANGKRATKERFSLERMMEAYQALLTSPPPASGT